MAAKKKVQPKGGTEWRFPVLTGRNNTVTWVGTDGEVSTEGDDPVEIARYEPKFVVASVKKVFVNEYKNSGPEQLIDMVDTSIKLAKNEVSQALEDALLGDGTLVNGPDGMQKLVATVPTTSATIGGINQSDDSWWRNQTYALQGDAVDYLSKDARHLHRLCGKFGPVPNAAFCDGDVYELIQNTLEEKHTFIDDEMKDFGWPDVVIFQGKPVIWSDSCEAGTLRFVNLDDIMLYYDPAVWFMLGDWIKAQGNINEVAHLKSALNLVAQRRATSGVLTAVDG